MISIQTEFITSNDRPFGRPIIYTDKNSKRNFDYSLMGTPCLTIIASNVFKEKSIAILIG